MQRRKPESVHRDRGRRKSQKLWAGEQRSPTASSRVWTERGSLAFGISHPQRHNHTTTRCHHVPGVFPLKHEGSACRLSGTGQTGEQRARGQQVGRRQRQEPQPREIRVISHDHSDTSTAWSGWICSTNAPLFTSQQSQTGSIKILIVKITEIIITISSTFIWNSGISIIPFI